MNRVRKWQWCIAGAILAISTVLALSRSQAVEVLAFSNITSLLLLLSAMAIMLRNGLRGRGPARAFWILMASGFGLWASNQAGWTVYELVLRRPMPDPFFGDSLLFLHIVPFMAAVALRPHRSKASDTASFGILNALMLLLWWVFLYAFLVFPQQYISLDAPVYTHVYDVLYMVESLMFLAMLGGAVVNARGDWARIYLHLLGASGLYTLNAQAMNAAIVRGTYHSGSWYDLPYMASLCWFVMIGLRAGELRPEAREAEEGVIPWMALVPKLAMLAILSLPLFAFWTIRYDPVPAHLRQFRLLTSLAAMLALGSLLFLKQYLLDRELTRLLSDSQRSLDNLQRLQTELVQKEKLASLGQLVSGAAHEINNPLAAILGYSELLAGNDTLAPEQVTMAKKIAQQARRTRDLVADLLSFAQQTPAEKAAVDMGVLLQRAVQIEALQLEGKKIRIETKIEPNLPRVWGNTNQLFQACVQIIGNAIDALEEVNGGTLTISACQEANELVLKFSDTGPGMREPEKVFDPFYTTKPVGKGTGLGLSATYGVVQNHQGQITCYNKADEGAVFILRFPVAKQPGIAVAASAER